MFIFKKIADLQDYISKQAPLQPIGLVPTMGALHAGHISLITDSKNQNCHTVCSIFVNPTQFNNQEDLLKYPISVENDIKLLTAAGCDVLFLPTAKEMYGEKPKANLYDYGTITSNYEGEKRPGHFDGVLTIVSKLFQAVEPNQVFFGQKDLQQCMVIRKLIKQEFPDIKFNLVPTFREASGLAASSRNRRLSVDDSQLAANIFHALTLSKQLIKQQTQPQKAIDQAVKKYLNNDSFRLEYFDLINVETMQSRINIDEPGNYALVIACWFAEVRLIDNMLLTD